MSQPAPLNPQTPLSRPASASQKTEYRLKKIQYGYGDSFQLSIDELEIAAGEIFCLLGPTGAGKSTLLRLLAALTAPRSGEIHLGQQRLLVKNIPAEQRQRIVMVHQTPLLLTGSVRSNVEYPLKLRKRPSPAPRVDAILEQLGLTKFSAQAAHTLSGGQRQLVALARALVVQADVLLLDEPTAHLDPAHVALVEQVISDLHQQQGTTIVWSSHNLFQVQRVADRVSLLLAGQVVETAPSKTFFENPSDPRAADFVRGKMIY